MRCSRRRRSGRAVECVQEGERGEDWKRPARRAARQAMSSASSSCSSVAIELKEKRVEEREGVGEGEEGERRLTT